MSQRALRYCWCPGYRGAFGWAVHKVGAKGFMTEHCVDYEPEPELDKDTQMREVVRSSFVRVSNGLIDMACLNGDVPPRAVPRSSRVHCGHTDEVQVLLAQRDELINMIEELIEPDHPDVDRVYYYRRIQRMRYAAPNSSGKERKGSAAASSQEGVRAPGQ